VLTSATYHSRFLKADARPNESVADCSVYVSALDEIVIIRDIFLAHGSGIDLDLISGYQNILLPIVGTMTVMGSDEPSKQIGPGIVYRSANGAGKLFLKNTYPEETINFLHICIKKNSEANYSRPDDAVLDITVKNKLIAGSGFAGNIRVGVYDSRVKDVVHTAQKDGGLAAYIINGSFEVDGRLMEYRDGLLLRDVAETDFEALSEIAIILLIDYSL
jgi:hypothetical protein